jgi:hypothetical protein
MNFTNDDWVKIQNDQGQWIGPFIIARNLNQESFIVMNARGEVQPLPVNIRNMLPHLASL